MGFLKHIFLFFTKWQHEIRSHIQKKALFVRFLTRQKIRNFKGRRGTIVFLFPQVSSFLEPVVLFGASLALRAALVLIQWKFLTNRSHTIWNVSKIQCQINAASCLRHFRRSYLLLQSFEVQNDKKVSYKFILKRLSKFVWKLIDL